MNSSDKNDSTATGSSKTEAESQLEIHVVRRLEDFPAWVSVDEFAEFLYESLKPYEDPLPVVKQGITDALAPPSGEPGFVLIAEMNQKLLGGLIMLRTGMKDYVPENFLLMVAVAPSTRGMRVGSQVIKRSFELADGDVKLHVEYDNPAKRLYERLGMTTKYAEMRYYK